jgi:hypothetical protein
MAFGVLVERRRAADAICLHDSTLNELREKFCFRETKKCDFCIFSLTSRPAPGVLPLWLRLRRAVPLCSREI